jgi:hypothetical protein
MALRTHMLSGRLKTDFDEVVEAIFQGVERPYERIPCILIIKKKRLE